MERKLAAIFSADVQGYSRLMGDNEEATVETLTTYREVMAALIQQHRGRVVDSPGDNLLAEFASVVDAVQGAVAIQRELVTRNAALPDHRQMRFRIGINLGDVLVDGERIYGDGVNIAARLEGLAEGGGICISGTAYDQVKNKLALGYVSMGEHSVKNITDPVRVYRVQVLSDAVIPEGRNITSDKPAVQVVKPRYLWVTTAIAVILLFIGVAFWFFNQRAPLPASETTVGVVDETSVLPKQSSVAVLPFNNMSNDPEQKYFSDGITEDLITDLSKISGLLVVSRNAVFRYKDEAAGPRKLRHELGVRYVIEGSIRKVENRVRVNARLIDTENSFHLWAEQYDHDLSDIFALQDQLTGRIVDALKLTLSKTEKTLLKKGRTNVPEAYDALLRARKSYIRWTPESNALTIALQKRVIELDPQFILAYTQLSHTYFQKWILEGSTRPETLEQALEVALKAVEIDEGFAPAHMMVGWMRLWSRQYDAALDPMKRAIELDPTYSEGMARLGEALMFWGNPDEALRYSMMARERVLYEPYPYNFWLGEVYFYLDRHIDAVKELKRAIEGNPNFYPARRFLAAVYAEMGLLEKAREQVEKALERNPKLSIDLLRRQLPFRNPADLERQLDALRQAGLK